MCMGSPKRLCKNGVTGNRYPETISMRENINGYNDTHKMKLR